MTKRWRLTLGKSAELSILSFLEQLVMAKNAPKTLKAAFLLKASGLLEVSTLKFRLMLEMKLVKESLRFKVQFDP